MKDFMGKHKRLLGYFMVVGCFTAAGIFTIGGKEAYGAWSLVPPVMMFLFALLTQSVIEGFIWGGLLAVFMIHRQDTFVSYLDGISATLANEDNVYLILIFLFIGIFIIFLKRSGSAGYFADWLASKTKNKTVILLMSWILGIVLSVDEYMSGFTVGASMTPVNDERKIPREMTAYVIRSSGVSPSCMHPIGPWAIFIASILESIGFAQDGMGMTEYMKVVPFLFFNMSVLMISLLVILGVIPKFGKIKKAYERVEQGGPSAPVVAGKDVIEVGETIVVKKGVNLLSFIVPIAALIISAFVFEFNMVYGIIAAVIVMIILYLIQGIVKVSEIIDMVVDGIRNLVELTVFLVIGITLADAVTNLGFTDFVVQAIQGYLTPQLLPVVIFIAFAVTEYLVTFNWTLYMIALPAVISLAEALGTNVYLAIAALICAGVWGSNSSFSSDGGIIVSSSCKIDLYEHNMSQVLYMLIAAILAAVSFLIAGIVIA